MPMRFLADENFPHAATAALRTGGHDVLSVKESMRGMPDRLVHKCGADEQRTLLTCDKDFGELAIRDQIPACGIVLFRLSGCSPEADINRMLAVIAGRTDWEGHFSVVTDERIRMRRLPKFDLLD